MKIMNFFWDEAFMGGQYTDGPDFRYIHAGEISGFFILSAFILKNYFNNFPNFGGIWSRAILRTVICLIGGSFIYLFYFSAAATFFLGKVPGFAQPGDTPLVWTILFLSVIMIQHDFFEGWPLRRTSGMQTGAEEIPAEMARNTTLGNPNVSKVGGLQS